MVATFKLKNMKTKQLAADATPATGGETPNTKKVQLIPTKDADLATVAKADPVTT